MDDLLRKYLDGNISIDELHRLREQVNSSSIDDIGETMSDDWDEFLGSQSKDAADTIVRLKAEIDRRIEMAPQKHKLKLERIYSIAASILLPLVIVAAAYMYFDGDRSGISKPACVMTAAGERAKVVLPDGTEVQLNSKSKIEYYADYVNGKRCADFSGEAYFNVAKDAAHPFNISTNGVDIDVKGTSFNLSARSNDGFVELALDNGRVELRADNGSEVVTLAPGQIALVNRLTGDISVTTENSDARTAWMRNEIVLVNVSPEELFERIEETYGVTVPASIKDAVKDRFTGTLPSDNLEDAYAVLARIYGFKR